MICFQSSVVNDIFIGACLCSVPLEIQVESQAENKLSLAVKPNPQSLLTCKCLRPVTRVRGIFRPRSPHGDLRRKVQVTS